MNTILRQIHRTLLFYGFDAKKFLKAVMTSTPNWYNADFKEFRKQMGKDKTFILGKAYRNIYDKNDEGGTMKGHYFYQDLYVARLIYLANPKKHLDIGSRTDGFVAHVATFREIEIIDIRKIQSKVNNVIYRQADLMELPADLIGCYDSISSLHAIEHFGLGRYGDPIDYFGYRKAVINITKILNDNGTFYFSVPIGPQRIEFNAHRVFSIQYLIDFLSEDFSIVSFSYINDEGDFFENIELSYSMVMSNCNCYYGCGIFICRKK